MGVLKYYIAHKGKRIGEALTKEEAIIELFKLRGAFTDLSIQVFDDNNKLRKVIPRKKPPNEP